MLTVSDLAAVVDTERTWGYVAVWVRQRKSSSVSPWYAGELVTIPYATLVWLTHL